VEVSQPELMLNCPRHEEKRRYGGKPALEPGRYSASEQPSGKSRTSLTTRHPLVSHVHRCPVVRENQSRIEDWPVPRGWFPRAAHDLSDPGAARRRAGGGAAWLGHRDK